jgi:hypothetical protein
VKSTARLAGAGIVGAAAIAAFAAPASASESTHWSVRPVFVQTDNTAGNSVVAYHRRDDGTLTRAGNYATGGRGGILDGSVVDHLASQGSLAYDRAHGLLYAVNAGSNTVTVFAVHGDELRRVQVISSGGTFPVSVAFHGGLVYVANALNGGSIQGYLRVGDRLVRVPSWNRALGLDPTAAPQFTNTPGQVAFTPDGSRLIVTTKANGNSVEVFRVGLFGPGRAAVTSLPGTVPFAVSFDPAGHVVLAEAANSVATFTMRADGTLRQLDSVPTGQQATCWVVGTGNRFYASNAGSGTLSGYRTARSGALSPVSVTSTDAGTVDATITRDGRYLYAQTGAAGIVDEFAVNRDGTLRSIGSVTVPDAVGGEGIAAG